MKTNSLLISQPTLFNTLTILSCCLGVAGWKAGLNVNVAVDPETDGFGTKRGDGG